MKKRMELLFAALLAMSSATITIADDFTPGRILVAPKAGASQAHFEDAIKQVGGKAKRVGQSNLHIVTLPQRASERAVAALLSRNKDVEFAEVDREVKPAFVPSDPYYSSAWHLTKIEADFAWDKSQGSGVTIAILDSGVDPTHPDLQSKLVPGWNFYSNNSVTSDVYGHGTMVAGAAAAITANSVGVAGVAGQARIMPIRVTDTSGMGYYSMIAQGIIYAADNGARVANASFLGLTNSASIQNAAQYMKNKGGLVTVSGGNTGALESYAQTSSMISVSATDANDYRAGWSSYGNYISVAAPGVGIWTTSNGGNYGAPSGTSFSSPVTAGVIALMMAANPSLSSAQLENILFATAVDLGTVGKDIYFGHGRINANQAVIAAQSASAPDTTPPVVSIGSPVAGQTVSGSVNVLVSATDNVAVDRVDFRVNNSTVATDTTPPYDFVWNTNNSANGQASLTAFAVDSSGNSKLSSAVTVNVSNGTTTNPKDTTAPSIRIVSPVAGSVSGKFIQITLEASDNNGSAGITQKLYIDGSVVSTGTGGQLTYNWNTSPKKVRGGSHVISATATDAAGNTSSTSVTINLIK